MNLDPSNVLKFRRFLALILLTSVDPRFSSLTGVNAETSSRTPGRGKEGNKRPSYHYLENIVELSAISKI